MKTKLNNEKNPDAVSLQRETLAGIQDFNNVLTSSQAVHPIFQGHYFSMETGENGIVSLIKQILNENAAVMVAGIETSPLRNIAIGHAMFADEIFQAVQSKFSAGSSRYPLATVRDNLSTVMFKKMKIIGKIQLTGAEDTNRDCARPRCKWYLISRETIL